MQEYVTIPLTQGKVAVIDAADYPRVAPYRWCAVWTGWRYYARNTEGTYLHRLIMDALPSEQIDHEDLDGLRCTRKNLRRATCAQNNQNKNKHPNNTSGYKGVYWSKVRGKWMAYISKNGTRYNLGYYERLEDAARVYDMKARELHGEFARLNFPNQSIAVKMTTTGRWPKPSSQ